MPQLVAYHYLNEVIFMIYPSGPSGPSGGVYPPKGKLKILLM